MIAKNNRSTEKHQRWAALMDAYHHSGLTRKAFCQQNNIPASHFSYYRRVIEGKTAACAPAQLMPIKIASPSVPPVPREIRLGWTNGMHCTFPSDLECARIQAIVKMVLSCCS